MSSDPLASALGVRPLAQIEQKPSNVRVVEPTDIVQLDEREMTDNHSADADFEQARAATQRAVDAGLKALDEILEVAKSSEHPRAYEVAANMVNTVTNAAQQLMKLQKMRQEISTPEENSNQDRGPTNVIVMSTTDMLRQIREELKKK